MFLCIPQLLAIFSYEVVSKLLWCCIVLYLRSALPLYLASCTSPSLPSLLLLPWHWPYAPPRHHHRHCMPPCCHCIVIDAAAGHDCGGQHSLSWLHTCCRHQAGVEVVVVVVEGVRVVVVGVTWMHGGGHCCC